MLLAATIVSCDVITQKDTAEVYPENYSNDDDGLPPIKPPPPLPTLKEV